MKEEILCQKQKIGSERIDAKLNVNAAVVYNFSINNAYFWVNPNLDLEAKLLEIKHQLTQTTTSKRRKLKSK